MTKEGGKLRSILIIAEIFGKEGLHNLGFDIPSASDTAKADDTELQEITENAARNVEDLIMQFDDPLGDSLEHLLCERLSLDKELRKHKGFKMCVHQCLKWLAL